MLTSDSLYKSLTPHVTETVEFGSSVREDETERRELQLQSGDRESDAGGTETESGCG